MDIFSYILLGDIMEEYRLANKYFKNKNKMVYNNKYLISLINRILLSFLLLIICLCIVKTNDKYKLFIKENVYSKNISFTKINKLYENWFGKIYPIENIEKKTNVKLEPVFSENLAYTNMEEYKEGVKLSVDNNYLVPVLESGIVVYKGDKDNYGYTIIIQQVNGIDLWYVGLKKNDLKLYDYVEKGKLLGEVENNLLYLFYQKDGKFVSYKEYLG